MTVVQRVLLNYFILADSIHLVLVRSTKILPLSLVQLALTQKNVKSALNECSPSLRKAFW